jgi:hypothetical protein
MGMALVLGSGYDNSSVRAVFAVVSIFLYILSLRPSVDKKNYRYFFSFFKQGLFFCIGTTALWFITHGFSGIIGHCTFFYCIVLSFFLTDVPFSLRGLYQALVRSCSLITNSLYFFIATYVGSLVLFCMYMLCAALVTLVGALCVYAVGSVPGIVLLWPFFKLVYVFIQITMAIFFMAGFVSWLHTFYVHKVYEHFNLYFS